MQYVSLCKYMSCQLSNLNKKLMGFIQINKKNKLSNNKFVLDIVKIPSYPLHIRTIHEVFFSNRLNICIL